MLIVKDKHVEAVDAVLQKLMNNTEFDTPSPLIDVRYRKDGFLMNDGAVKRYVIFTSCHYGNGVVLECGLFNSKNVGDTVMCVLENGDLDTAARNIFKWFTVEDGELFTVPANGGLEEHNVRRRDGQLKRYKQVGV